MRVWRGGEGAIAVAGVAVLVQLGCAGVLEPLGLGDLMAAGSPVILERDLLEGEVVAALSLAERVDDRRFPREDARNCDELAAQFTWLGAYTAHDDVAEAAMWAMDECIDEVKPADALSVAAYRLGSEEPSIVGPAIWVGSAYLAEAPPEHPVVAALVDVATRATDLGIRIEALEALDERAWSQEPAVADAFFEALMAEWKPPLTATALERLRYRGAGLNAQDRGRFLRALMVLASDLDPGIRGYSALALARIAPEDEDVRARVLGLLRDEHAYTRSAAAQALADMAYLPAVHELVEGLDDPEPNQWRMLPYERPDGSTGRMRFVGSRFTRVDDAFLRALEQLTSMRDVPFRYRHVNLRYRDLDIASAVRDARDWYDAHGASIPRRGDDAVASMVDDLEAVEQAAPTEEER